ncbi:unnamed protein product [Lota lota]
MVSFHAHAVSDVGQERWQDGWARSTANGHTARPTAKPHRHHQCLITTDPPVSSLSAAMRRLFVERSASFLFTRL